MFPNTYTKDKANELLKLLDLQISNYYDVEKFLSTIEQDADYFFTPDDTYEDGLEEGKHEGRDDIRMEISEFIENLPEDEDFEERLNRIIGAWG